MNDQILARLNTWFKDGLHIQVPSPDTDMLEAGLIDSVQIVELLLQLEDLFGFKISVEDIDLDNLKTLNRLASLVAEHAAAAGIRIDAPASAAARPAGIGAQHVAGAPAADAAPLMGNAAPMAAFAGTFK